MRHADQAHQWKLQYWTQIRDFAQQRLSDLRRGGFELRDKSGRDLISDQIAHHERDLASANERLEELQSN